jgi:diguanylate cyclase (GGDEF)-like protein
MALTARMPRLASHRLRQTAIGFVLVALPLSLLLTVTALTESLERRRAATRSVGIELSRALQYELLVRQEAVEAIAAQAEELVSGRVRPTQSVVEHLVPVPAHGGYALGSLPSYGPPELGSLMGEGAIPTADSPAAAEMAMAVALTPAFTLLRRNHLEIPWVYYASKRGFLYITPRAPEGEFLWSHDLLERYDGKGANAKVSPTGVRTGWSAVYQDKGGKGLMTTVSRLVVQHGQTIGDLSLDMGVSTLGRILESHTLPDAYLHLLDGDGKAMISPGHLPAQLDVRTAPRREATVVGDAEVWLFEVPPTGWLLAVSSSRRANFLHALGESSVYGLMALFVLASLLLLVALTRALQTLATVSVRDALTGLYNRRHFDSFVEGELAKTRRGGLPVGLALLDVDHFKRYNDRYGHQAGDRVLRAVAEALRSSCKRASDTLFRVGGEEFAVVASVERPEQMAQLCDKICTAVRNLELEHGASPAGRLTISVGMTTIAQANWGGLDDAYQRADQALYRAKEAGRDRVEAG